MRSVVVVLPASMCAMIPMFRVRSRGNSRLAMLYYFRVKGRLGRRDLSD